LGRSSIEPLVARVPMHWSEPKTKESTYALERAKLGKSAPIKMSEPCFDGRAPTAASEAVVFESAYAAKRARETESTLQTERTQRGERTLLLQCKPFYLSAPLRPSEPFALRVPN